MKDFSLSDVRLFTKAVELGGLTQAADVLRVPKASASRQLQRLEATVGHLLLHRGAAHFGLTEEGREFLLTAQSVLTTLDQAMSNLSPQANTPIGHLRVAIPDYLGRELLASHLPVFMNAHPGLDISVESGRADVDLGRDEADVAIRCGREGCDEMVARHLKDEPMVLCASPVYLARHPEIRDIQDLASHFFLTTQMDVRDKEVLISTLNAEYRLKMAGVFCANDPELLLRLAFSGKGIALLPRILVRSEIEKGALVPLLPHCGLRPVEINLVYLPTRRRSPKIRIFVDYMLGVFRRD
jgi:DNA-binding transcriptional LysR family regulator